MICECSLVWRAPADDAPLAGVRVVEVATHVFAPMAGAVLAEWGADVLKVEPPGPAIRTAAWSHRPPPAAGRGSTPTSSRPTGGSGRWASTSSTPRAGTCWAASCGTADVFVTSLRPGARGRLAIDVEDVRADNPAVLYVRASAFGPRAPRPAGWLRRRRLLGPQRACSTASPRPGPPSPGRRRRRSATSWAPSLSSGRSARRWSAGPRAASRR